MSVIPALERIMSVKPAVLPKNLKEKNDFCLIAV